MYPSKVKALFFLNFDFLLLNFSLTQTSTLNLTLSIHEPIH